MSGNQHANEPREEQDRQPSGRDRSDPSDREPDDDPEIGRAHPSRDNADDAESSDYIGVAHGTNRGPKLEDEADEEELAEADLMDADDLDDLEHMDGPDA
jgi:hypothetical protein